MTRLRRKPSPEIEGYEWKGDRDTIPSWVREEGVEILGDRLQVRNASGILIATEGDWVVRRKPGDVYVVTAADREELFEIVDGA